MCRMYVIMREREGCALPYDVVHSMTRADELCTEYEAQDLTHIYYWYEVISSEEE
jgi:hypothetical protein